MKKLMADQQGHVILTAQRTADQQGLLICWLCGHWCEKAPQKLGEPCLGRPAQTEGGRQQRIHLQRVMRGRHPQWPTVAIGALRRWDPGGCARARGLDLEELEKACGLEESDRLEGKLKGIGWLGRRRPPRMLAPPKAGEAHCVEAAIQTWEFGRGISREAPAAEPLDEVLAARRRERARRYVEGLYAEGPSDAA